MRIISGKFKGTTLYGPTNNKVRPLKDMVKESIFNFLTHSNKISFQLERSNILDLYSGTGSFGLECLSRQAGKVIFIEEEKEIFEILKKNIEKLREKDKTKIFFGDVLNTIKEGNEYLSSSSSGLNFDLIFCDPPFKDTNIEQLIELIFNKDLLNKNGIIILHRNKFTREKLPNYFEIVDERTYGISKIIFGKFLF